MNYTILYTNLAKMQATINATNRAANIARLPELVVKISEPYVVDDKYSVDVSITGDFRQSGWQIIGKKEKINNDSSSIVIKTMEELPFEFQGAMKCEHCNSNRSRNTTFLLKKENEYKEIGSTCLSFFFGVNVDNLMEYWQCLLEIEDYSNYAKELKVFSLDQVLAVTAARIRIDGFYLSKRKAEDENLCSTAQEVTSSILKEDNIDFLPIDFDNAKAAREWAANITPSNSSYEISINQIANQSDITKNVFGFACSILPSYFRAMNAPKENKEEKIKPISQHVGNLKEKIKEIQLKVESKIPFEGMYGISYIHKLYDNAGNCYVWFTNNSNMEKGEEYLVKGTITGHDEFQGEKQTKLSRCTFRPLPSIIIENKVQGSSIAEWFEAEGFELDK